ncbi:hypothetical protein BS47DRAFT_1383305 [Hydnum rufescens UP504]|uniref:NADP-dependent oxidoreductase domain-containing protein n=1 Tax=Hydnum rufescens UP504 TaxID=1448309 RepID=A0A9P6AT88_9AGAM|nr:hypothetical protein BS47DRAFT_1383305 [Hydnum rufescens UP504]
MSFSLKSSVDLPNSPVPGAQIPLIGLGTYAGSSGGLAPAVKYAVKEAGFRHIDAAYAYFNEKEVGEGIRDSGVPRSEIFITSKVWNTHHRQVEECLDIILSDLGTDYVDLLLIHWPIAMNPKGNSKFLPTREDGSYDIDEEWKVSQTWEQMEAVQRLGKAKQIGVSNFSEWMLETNILPIAKIKPAVNQIELHPYNPQHKLVAYLKKQGIVPVAYSPLGALKRPIAFGRSAKGIPAIPKSSKPSRILTNGSPAQLTPDDVAKLDALSNEPGKQKRFVKLPWGVKLGFEDWDIAETARKQ